MADGTHFRVSQQRAKCSMIVVANWKTVVRERMARGR
jgi:hypothetical protein